MAEEKNQKNQNKNRILPLNEICDMFCLKLCRKEESIIWLKNILNVMDTAEIFARYQTIQEKFNIKYSYLFDATEIEAVGDSCHICKKKIWGGLRISDSYYHDFEKSQLIRGGKLAWYCKNCAKSCGCSPQNPNPYYQKLCTCCEEKKCTKCDFKEILSTVCKGCKQSSEFGKYVQKVVHQNPSSFEEFIKCLQLFPDNNGKK